MFEKLDRWCVVVRVVTRSHRERSCDASTVCSLCGRASIHVVYFFFFLMIRRPPRSTLDRSSAASDVYKRQVYTKKVDLVRATSKETLALVKKGVTLSQNSIDFQFSDINSIKPEMLAEAIKNARASASQLSLIHISEPTRPY